MSRLFRQSAVEHAGNRGFGSIVVTTPPSQSVFAILVLLVSLGLACFVATAEYSRKVTISGSLVPTQGVFNVVAPQGGIVTKRRVYEGQKVRQGETLFILSSPRVSASLGDTEGAISELLRSRQRSLAKQREHVVDQLDSRRSTAQRKVQRLGEELRQLDQAIDLQHRRIELADTSVQRVERLVGEGFVSSVKLQDQQAEALDQRQREVELQRLRSETIREFDAAQAELMEVKFQALHETENSIRESADTDRALAENESRREVALIAPHSGIVAAVLIMPGQTVAAETLVAVILPDGAPLVAEMYAPSRAAGLLQPGMPVRLQYHSFPYQKFGLASGVIEDISATSLALNDRGIQQPASKEPVYRVRASIGSQVVVANGREIPLKVGMTLDCVVAVEKRRIYEWILEPLSSFGG